MNELINCCFNDPNIVVIDRLITKHCYNIHATYHNSSSCSVLLSISFCLHENLVGAGGGEEGEAARFVAKICCGAK